MIIRSDVLQGIAEGRITLAFRRWQRPSVRTGGTLLTAIGQVRIASVAIVDERAITERDATQAGYSSLDALLEDLHRYPGPAIYRIEFGSIAADPRVHLRESVPGPVEIEAICRRLAALDGRSPAGPWTQPVLRLLAEAPGVHAAELARRMGMEKLPFKANVRKLKTMGLTISLACGYRLSPRGEAVLAALSGSPPPP